MDIEEPVGGFFFSGRVAGIPRQAELAETYLFPYCFTHSYLKRRDMTTCYETI